MGKWARGWMAAGVLWVSATTAEAQVAVSVSPGAVTPGSTVGVTVTGTPGHYVAILGSSMKAGVSHAGVALAVGGDFAVLVTGQIDGTGTFVVGFNPPFLFTSLDRYYLQAV